MKSRKQFLVYITLILCAAYWTWHFHTGSRKEVNGLSSKNVEMMDEGLQININGLTARQRADQPEYIGKGNTKNSSSEKPRDVVMPTKGKDEIDRTKQHAPVPVKYPKVTYESCAASLQAAGLDSDEHKSLTKIVWPHFPKCGATFKTVLFGYLCTETSPSNIDAYYQLEELHKNNTIPSRKPSLLNPRCWYCDSKDQKVELRWNPSSPFLPLATRKFCREDVTYYGDPIGHFPVDQAWYEADFMPKRFLVANFRDPRERLVSAYNSMKHSYGLPGPYRDDMLQNHSHNVFEYASYPGIAGCQAKMLLGIPCAAMLNPKKHPGSPNHPTLPQLISRAKEVVKERSAFVGLTAQYNMSVCLFHHMFGGKLERFEMELRFHSGKHRYDSNGGSMSKKLGGSKYAEKYEWQTLPTNIDEADYQVFKLVELIFIKRLLDHKLIKEEDILDPTYRQKVLQYQDDQT